MDSKDSPKVSPEIESAIATLFVGWATAHPSGADKRDYIAAFFSFRAEFLGQSSKK
jgi:hypothetical protein